MRFVSGFSSFLGNPTFRKSQFAPEGHQAFGSPVLRGGSAIRNREGSKPHEYGSDSTKESRRLIVERVSDGSELPVTLREDGPARTSVFQENPLRGRFPFERHDLAKRGLVDVLDVEFR